MGILHKLKMKAGALEDAWLWFIAIAFSIMGFCAFIVWVGSICLFLYKLIKGC